MANEITPGIFDAKVSDYGIGKTKKGDPMAMIRFSFTDKENNEHFINWYGTFVHPKAAEISCETLAVCGWTTNSPADLSKGAGSGVLDENRTISITLKSDTYDGKTSVKVAYVNPPGGAGFRDSMDQGDAVQAFSGLNLGGVAAAARKKYSSAAVPRAIPNMAPNAGIDTTEEIPF